MVIKLKARGREERQGRRQRDKETKRQRGKEEMSRREEKKTRKQVKPGNPGVFKVHGWVETPALA